MIKNPLQTIIAKAVEKAASKGALKTIISSSTSFDMVNPINARGLDPAQIAQILEDALNGDLVQQSALFDIMEDSWDRLRLNMDKIKGAVIATKFEVIPFADRGKDPSSSAQEKAAFIEDALKGFKAKPWKSENDYGDTIYDIMDAIGRGISVLEIHWRKGTASEYLLNHTKRVPPTRYRIGESSGVDETRDELRLFPDGLSGTGHDFDEFPHKFLIGVYRTKSGNLAASALLRSLAAFWVGKTFGWEWLLNRAQLFGIPIRWATYKTGDPKLINDVCNMLLNMGSAGWGAFPEGTNMNLISADAKGVNDPNERLMSIADTACDIMLLGQTLTTDVGASGGNRALGEVHREVELDKREAYANFVARVFNSQLIPAVVELNYGNTEELPTITHKIARPKNEKDMADRDKVLIFDMGLPVSKKWLYERHGIPFPAEGDDLFEPKAAEAGSQALPPATAKAVKAKGYIMAADKMLEELTGVAQQWLGPVKQIFYDLMKKASDTGVSDADLVAAIEEAKKKMPELFDKLDTETLADYMERVMGAEVINGAIEGAKRK